MGKAGLVFLSVVCIYLILKSKVQILAGFKESTTGTYLSCSDSQNQVSFSSDV